MRRLPRTNLMEETYYRTATQYFITLYYFYYRTKNLTIKTIAQFHVIAILRIRAFQAAEGRKDSRIFWRAFLSEAEGSFPSIKSG